MNMYVARTQPALIRVDIGIHLRCYRDAIPCPPEPENSRSRPPGETAQVVTAGAFAERELPRNAPVRHPLGGQRLDGHADLQIGARHVRLRHRCDGGRGNSADPKMRKYGCRLTRKLSCRSTQALIVKAASA
jgi:hypothetical protein